MQRTNQHLAIVLGVFVLAKTFTCPLFAADDIPDWVKQLERLNIPFEIDWNLEVHHRPNPKLAAMMRKDDLRLSRLIAEKIEHGQIHTKKISAVVESCFEFEATMVDVNVHADNATTIYTGEKSDGCKVEMVDCAHFAFYPDPMIFFGDLFVGLPQTQIIDFLPSANSATVIEGEAWPRIYELLSDDP